jgi:monofunctional biosynthetic peptidoglycan transglycosylase
MPSRKRSRLLSWYRKAVLLAILIALLPLGLTALYSVVPPVSTLMLARWATLQPVDRRFVPYAQIAPVVAASVIGSEDARFCRHHGVDWDALRLVIADSDDEDGPMRGASTIAMQTAKNLFLWPGRSYIRKGLEIPLALMLDFVWTKQQLLTTYLNIAEWGDGIFGIEAAAQIYFHRPASRLSAHQAALLAAALPNPILRDTARPKRGQRLRASRVAVIARGMKPWLDCLP